MNKKKADLEKKLERNGSDEQSKVELPIVQKCIEALDSGKWVKDMTWTSLEIFYLNKWLFLTAKPVIYLVNCGS